MFQDVLDFWFTEVDPKQHYVKDADFDDLIRTRFGAAVAQAQSGALQADNTPHGRLGYIILLDQFTRNIFRDTPQAFGADDLALRCTLDAVLAGDLRYWEEPRHRSFVLMPMMHSENIDVQNASLPLFETYCGEMTHDFAVRHRDIIARFGRFPHRNAILGRTPTTQERAFLEQPGSSF